MLLLSYLQPCYSPIYYLFFTQISSTEFPGLRWLADPSPGLSLVEVAPSRLPAPRRPGAAGPSPRRAPGGR